MEDEKISERNRDVRYHWQDCQDKACRIGGRHNAVIRVSKKGGLKSSKNKLE